MVMAAAAAAASSSDDHELLLNRFLPYSTTSSSSSSQLYLNQTGGSSATSLSAPTNGAGNAGGGSLVSSGNLRDAHSAYSSLHSGSHSAHTHPAVVASRGSTEAAVAAIYGGIPDVISLDWLGEFRDYSSATLQSKTDHRVNFDPRKPSDHNPPNWEGLLKKSSFFFHNPLYQNWRENSLKWWLKGNSCGRCVCRTDVRRETGPEPTGVYWYQRSTSSSCSSSREAAWAETQQEGSFLQTPGVAPCTENKIYFPLLLLYVKLEHFQSSELLQSLFWKLEVFSTQKLKEMPVPMQRTTSSLYAVLTMISGCSCCFSLLLRLIYELVLYRRGWI